MAGFEVKIVKIDDVIDHPNADRLSLVKIAGYSVVSGKLEDGSHRYKAGDLVAYVPENSVVPEYLLKQGYWNENDNKGMLAGKEGNRVKPIKLRNIISEGIMFPVKELVSGGKNLQVIHGESRQDEDLGNVNRVKVVEVGDEVSEFLGITKWEPEIPASMSGDVIARTDLPVKYDIENIKKYDKVFEIGDDVYMTEKLHGTQAQLGWLPGGGDADLIEGQFFASSKGIASQGLVFKDTDQNRVGNLYVRILVANIDKIKKLTEFNSASKVVLFGEIFGAGVQDLAYGETKPTFKVFDIWVDGKFLDFNDLVRVCDLADIPMVPILYVGQFTVEDLKRETAGKTKLGGGNHIREGVVIKPLKERENQWIGRVILKSISDEYLGRKNGTEFN